MLRVIDRGVGIEPELQTKIFDLFVQSEQRLDRSRGGLGVGLSLAKNIVDLHGGTIGFDEHVIKPAELAKLERILATRKPSAAH